MHALNFIKQTHAAALAHGVPPSFNVAGYGRYGARRVGQEMASPDCASGYCGDLAPKRFELQRPCATGRPRILPLGFSSGVPVPAGGGQATITTSPQHTFKAERLFVPSSIAFAFLIIDIIVGTASQLVARNQPLPAEAYSEVSEDSNIEIDTACPGIDVALIVQNIDTVDRVFFGQLKGPTIK